MRKIKLGSKAWGKEKTTIIEEPKEEPKKKPKKKKEVKEDE